MLPKTQGGNAHSKTHGRGKVNLFGALQDDSTYDNCEADLFGFPHGLIAGDLGDVTGLQNAPPLVVDAEPASATCNTTLPWNS